MRARDIMIKDVVAVRPDCLLSEMMAVLLGCGLSGVPVVNGEGRVVGMISEGDLLRAAAPGADDVRPRWIELLNRPQRQPWRVNMARRVEDLMSWPVVQVEADTSIMDIAEVFEHHRIKRVPVTEEGRLVGLVTCGNLLRALAAHVPRHDGPQMQDRWIKQIVMGELRRAPKISRGEEDVIVVDGVVHLWGLIDSIAERRRLLTRAKKVPGVAAVRDHTFAGRS